VIPRHGQGVPHEIGVVRVALRRDWAGVVNLVERLKLAEAKQAVKGDLVFWDVRVVVAVVAFCEQLQLLLAGFSLDQGVQVEVQYLLRDAQAHLEQPLQQALRSDEPTVVLVAFDEGLLQRLQVLEFNVEGTDALLNLGLLHLVELIFTYLIDNVPVLLVFIDVNRSAARTHFNGVCVSDGVLVLPKEGMILIVHTIGRMQVVLGHLLLLLMPERYLVHHFIQTIIIEVDTLSILVNELQRVILVLRN